MNKINKVAVLGAGVMGSALACHFANAGLSVVLLDIVPSGSDKEESRNSLVNNALKKCIKSKPAALFHKSFKDRIQTGNLSDHLHWIADCDWILEVVVERLDIKQSLYANVEEHRKPGTFITTNTSGIPIHLLEAGRSDDFKACFFGTHFFNPPRYLPLLEIIPGTETSQVLLDFFIDFAGNNLGKTSVICKDSPAFIANRIGVYAMGYIYELADEYNLSIKTIDILTGPAIARPKSGTFRLSDLVGMDVAMKVIQGMKANCPEDQMIRDLKIPDFFKYLVDNNYLGNKSGQGFYKKTEERDENGKRIILALDLKTQEYSKPQKDNLPSLSLSKQIDDPAKRIKALFESEDIGGQFIRRSLLALFSYASQRIPEVTDHLYSVDQALREGFGWEYGPFEYWDLLGVERCLELAETEGFVIADWVREMLKAGHPSFYQWTSNGRAFYGNQTHWGYHPLIEHQSIVHLRTTEEKPAVYKNDEITVHDIGDGILCLEFQSKMNAIGEGILNGLNETLALAEEQGWKGLVIGNHAPNYSVGANLMLMGMMAFQQQYDMLHMAVKLFQDTSMRCRYSNIPVVVATQGYVFGGGCEMAMHCDSIVAAAESYIGQVEVGVGLLPGGGGTKEFALRAGDSFFEGDVEIPTLIKYFKSLATGYVATSAHEALEAGYLSHHRDEVVMHKARNIGEAKKKALALSEGYLPPVPRKDITVLGRTGLAALYIAANELKRGGWASEHDIKIAKKIAYVMCGGDLSEKQQVDEQYLLDLEREAFMSLCTEPKTLERIQFMLEKGKPLRN